MPDHLVDSEIEKYYLKDVEYWLGTISTFLQGEPFKKV
jgi:hypothetical protein